MKQPPGNLHRLTPVRLREGYDMVEVDQLLDELESRARTGRD